MNEADLTIDKDAIRNVSLLYRAIHNDFRGKILNLIHKNGELKVTEIYTHLNKKQSETSQHLAILRRAGLVNARRDGKQIFYSVNYKRLKEIEAKANELNRIG